MPEAGGVTTQSGIFYQNTIAALYLGELLDLRTPVGRPRIDSVRVEAPEHIDDIVVAYADGSTLYIQAKEALSLRGGPWSKFCDSLRKQSAALRSERDRFLLILGNTNGPLDALREAVARAEGKENVTEWRNSLSKTQIRAATMLQDALAMGANEGFAVIRRTRVEVLTLSMAETTGVRNSMPDSSDTPVGLHGRLRDLCGGRARVRKVFRATELSELLLSKYGIRIHGSHGDGLERYRLAIASEFDHIAVPGTSISAREHELLVWPRIESRDASIRTDFEDEDPWIRRSYSAESVSLQDFPASSKRFIVLESGAGHGKSTLLKATARRLAAATTFIPAYVQAEFLSSSATLQEYLSYQHNARYQVRVDWLALCEQGRAALLIDGIDELNDGSRAAVIDMIRRAAARFPDASFLVGARDASIAELPPKFELFRLQKLDSDQMIAMLKSYVGARDSFDVQMIVRHVLSYRELELLCQVPLFLAIFVATIPKDGPIPASRLQVLERYIQYVLSPERHKGVGKSNVARTQLRQSMEFVALLALERNQSALSESGVRATLSKEFGRSVGDDCVDTLIQYGVLERRGAALAFSIPTVQEYLAGCALADSGRLEAANWAENIYRRPWAQAFQFAIEKIAGAASLLRQQLGREDDAFYTSLRLIARCIVNGVSVEEDFKNLIAQRLALAWRKGVHYTSVKVGGLIADGFCKPLHPDIRRALVDAGRYLPYKADVILRADDGRLTLECLESILAQQDIRDLWEPSWDQALKKVVPEAVRLLLKRAEAEGSSSTLSASVIAGSLYALRADMGIDWSAIGSNRALPLVVRIAGQFCSASTSSAEQRELINAAVGEAEHEMWGQFCEAYLSTSWWKEHMSALFRERSGGGVRMLEVALSDGPVNPQLLEFLVELAGDLRTDPEQRAYLQVLLGGFGYIEFAESATELLMSADHDAIAGWLWEALYLPAVVVRRGISILRMRALSVSRQVEALESLTYGVRHTPSGKRHSLRPHGPFTQRPMTHSENAAEVLEWAEQLDRSQDVSGSQRLRITRIRAQCGSKGALRDLIADIENYLDTHANIAEAEWNAFAETLHAIEESGGQLPISRLWQIIVKGENLPVSRVMEEIIAREGPSCYPELVKYFETGDSQSAKSAILAYFERNAERQGLKVCREGVCLSITRLS